MDMLNSHIENKDHEVINESTQILPNFPSFDPHFSSQKEHTTMEIEPGPPHEALFLVLAYLPLFDLLAMSEVCRSLRDAVNKDVLLWLDIVVERPLNLHIFDEILIRITSKADGRLSTLALINCVNITDDGLQRVIEENPLINKLYIPRCTGLTPDGVIRAVKTLTEHNPNLKSLNINGIYNIKKEHLETLHSYLQMYPEQQERQKQRPILFHEHRNFPALGYEESNSPIDVEICPKCNEVRMVFDCPRETCERKKRPLTECRGCYLCIPRCEECSGCIESEELDDTACEDFLCSDCWLQLPKCNFCNKPYCNRHADQQCSPPGSVGFVCEVCHVKFFTNPYD